MPATLPAVARLAALAFVGAILLSLIAPLSHGSNWTNPGNNGSLIEWSGSHGNVTITTNEAAGGFVFTETFTGGTFTVNSNVGVASLSFGTTGVVNNSSVTPILRATNGGYIYFAGFGSSLGNVTYEIASGSLRIRTDNNIDGSSATIVLQGGMVMANNSADGGTMSLGTVSGSGTIDFGTAALTIGSATDATFSGAIQGTLTGTAVTKVGSGTWTLTGASAYSGDTLISAGTVKIDNSTGSAFGTGAVTVSNGATLTGAGSFSGALQNNGTYSPGNSPTLATLSSFSQSSTGTLVLELGGLTRGTHYDALDISGAAAFDGTLTISLIDGFNPVNGSSFNLFDWGSVSGTFATLNLPTLGDGLSWNTSSLYTTGELSVGVSAVPEPSTYAAIVGACVLGLAIYRRRSSRQNNAVES